MRWTYRQKVNYFKFIGRIIQDSCRIPGLLSWFYILLPWFAYAGPVFTDALNQQVSLKSYPPQRIISLAPNITEILYGLGAQNQVVGVTDYCKYPPEAQQKEKVGGFINPNLEKIVSLNPDLVLITADSNQDKVFAQLTKLNIPVYVINPRNLNSTYMAISQIGDITDKKTTAQLIITSLKNRVDKIEQKIKDASRPGVLFLWSEDPLITAGKNTFTDDLIQLAGGTNVAHDSNIKYPKYGTEEILRLKPEIIITSAMESDRGDSTLYSRWKTWTDVPAIKNHKIYSMKADLLARPAPSMVDGLEALAKIIHPELFQK